jgi:cytochrome c biogenesis protein CcdA/thiol-disulfide isomerase/thioredoxin
MVLYLFAFLSGLVTIAAPCIWPLLPIVLSTTAAGGRRKPLGVTLGIITSFAFFTLTISYIVKVIPLDLDKLRLFAVVVIGFFGLTLIIPKLNQVVEGAVSRLSGRFTRGKTQGNGLVSGFITGAALGIVWSPCAGPILATIATLAATQKVDAAVVLVTIAYVAGVGVPLFLFSLLGQRVFSKTRKISKYTGRVQQIFGVIMILTAILILTGQDRVIQAKLLDAFPSYSNFLNKLEGNSAVTNGLNDLKKKDDEQQSSDPLAALLGRDKKAPEFAGISQWLNTDKPLTLKDLRGKVVMIDFWTYTCINCIRTLPYVTGWYEKYKDSGFIVVGVHTPEFEFEKKTENVQNAIKQYGINYPVAQDNNYETWNAYDNHYWPAHYLLDANGKIRKTHFGEGNYEETEKAIQDLLKEAGKQAAGGTLKNEVQSPQARLTPETYLGTKRAAPNDFLTLSDDFTQEAEYAESAAGSKLSLRFTASKVFLVITPPAGGGTISVMLDGKPVDVKSAGTDVKNGQIMPDTSRLYNLVDLHGEVGEHTLELQFKSAGAQLFAFTFG